MKRKHPQAVCEECPLASKPCAPTQFPSNGKTPVAAIVSRSPGHYEAMNGKPFSGPSGKVLDHLLKLNGVKRDDVIVTNTVLCAPPEGKVPPEAIKACAPRLDQEITGVPLVIACGSEAVNLLIGRGAIDRYRGYVIERQHQTNIQRLVATNNPALVLRDDSTFPNLRRDFARAFSDPVKPIFPTVEVIENAKDAKDYLSSIGTGVVACDIESRGGITHKASLISIQFSIDGRSTSVLGERQELWSDESFIQNHLRPFLEHKDRTFVWHGGKFDIKILRHTYGINARVDEDTMLLSYALDERSGTDERVGVHGLEYLLMDEFGWPPYAGPIVEKIKKTGMFMWPETIKSIKKNYKDGAEDEIVRQTQKNYELFYKYAGYDVGGTYQLYESQRHRAEKDNVLKPYYHPLISGNELLAGIEMNGMIYDKDRAADMYEFEVEPEMREMTEQMQQTISNPMLNPRSPIQMAAIFYDQYQCEHDMRSRPDKKRSVDDAARTEILEDRFEIGERYEFGAGKAVERADYVQRKATFKSFVEKYDRFQEIQKQASTYLIGMIKRAELDEDSRIYTQLNLHGTNSGRLSSSKPNLQNITRTKEGLPDIRKLFVASPGCFIVSADYSQAELRCIAHFSGDRELLRIYNNDLSLHKETATKFYGADYTGEQYSTCKNVNFGVFYRQSAETFQEKHGIPVDQASKYIEWVWKTFTGVAEWEKGVENEIRTKGQLVSPFGRKRRFYLLTRENVQAAFREGINFYPQSTASDLTLCGAITLAQQIDTVRAGLCILVHDSIVADVVESYVDEYRVICQQVMESTAKTELDWDMPFKVEIGVGPNWGEAK